MYCGDETGSFIGEIGSHTCRFGYGGEDNPKLTMPSYVVSNSSAKDSKQRRRMARFSSLHPPKEEEVMESILRMPCSSSSVIGGDDNSTSNSNDCHEPLTDPNCFLRQGEVVENWDNLQTAWEHSMDTLRATDTLKHTQGGTPYERTKKQKREHRRVAASGVSSASVVSQEDGGSDGRCVHPILAVTPGISECTSSSSLDKNEAAATGPKFQAAVKRQQHISYTEMLMESLDATSAFLAPAPMLAAFSLGRQTALVVDIGAGGCRVTPVVDGLVLKLAQRRSGRGGDWLGNVTWKALLEEAQMEDGGSSPGNEKTEAAATRIKPRYLLNNKYEGKQLSSVFHRRAMNDLMYEVRTEPFVKLYGMEDVEKIRIPFGHKSRSGGDITMSSPPGSPDAANKMDIEKPETPGQGSTQSQGMMGEPSIYELPDGTPVDLKSSSFGKDLCQLPELLFCDETVLPFRSAADANSCVAKHSTLSNLPLHELIRESLLAVGDVDARKELAGCICLVGASSLLPNLEKRLSQELTALLPSFVRPKVVAPKIASVERSCASWIGASILTSLGSFQQLWLSRAEYEEYGATLSIQRFP